MKALLLKDFYAILSNSKFYFIMMIIFLILPGALPTMALIYAALLPASMLAGDEGAKWPQLAAMLPYKRRDLVLSKYVLGYILCAGVIVPILAVRLLVGYFFPDDPDLSFNLSFLAMVLIGLHIALLFIALNLPFVFILGPEKGRLAYIACYILLFSAFGWLIGFTSNLNVQYIHGVLDGTVINISRLIMLLLAALPITVLLNALSIGISIKKYPERLING